MEILTGDIVRLKKKHPCGSFDWEVLRSGADFRLKSGDDGSQAGGEEYPKIGTKRGRDEDYPLGDGINCTIGKCRKFYSYCSEPSQSQ